MHLAEMMPYHMQVEGDFACGLVVYIGPFMGSLREDDQIEMYQKHSPWKKIFARTLGWLFFLHKIHIDKIHVPAACTRSCVLLVCSIPTACSRCILFSLGIAFGVRILNVNNRKPNVNMLMYNVHALRKNLHGLNRHVSTIKTAVF